MQVMGEDVLVFPSVFATGSPATILYIRPSVWKPPSTPHSSAAVMLDKRRTVVFLIFYCNNLGGHKLTGTSTDDIRTFSSMKPVHVQLQVVLTMCKAN